MKSKILGIFDLSDDFISGAEFSRRLGISRVGVWKHIRQLQALGYRIESSARGYRLMEIPDTPFPWSFGPRAKRIHYYPKIASTMEIAVEMARSGCENFTVVVADTQTKGRGRLKRSWQSDPGGLYFSMIVRQDASAAVAPLINLAAAVDLAIVLKQLYKIEARLKWPNDVLVANQKVAGILSFMETESDHVNFVSLGVGVNVNNSPRITDQPAASIHGFLNRAVARSQLLAAFLDRFENRMQHYGLAGVIDQWKELSTTLGKKVGIHTSEEYYEGIAIDIEPEGALIIETADGRQRRVLYGDCFHQP